MDDLELLKQQVAELMEWKNSRLSQQITYPLDDASRGAILDGSVLLEDKSDGSSPLTDDISLSGSPETITVPAPYAGSVVLTIEGTAYEFPYL